MIREALGNGVTSTHAYDESTGAEIGIRTVGKDNAEISSLKLKYDLIGNLESRTSGETCRHKGFTYGNLDRITSWTLNGRKTSYNYDGVGRLAFKSDTGVYHYDSPIHTHALTAISGSAGNADPKYEYDLNGNMTGSAKGAFVYNSSNQVQQILADNDNWATFKYAPDGSRFYETTRENRDTQISVSVGPYQRSFEYWSNSPKVDPDLTRHRLFISSDTGLVAVLERNTEFDQFDPYLGERPAALSKAQRSELVLAKSTSAHYVIKDQLGSVARVLDDEGFSEAIFVYDPWGEREDLIKGSKRPVKPGQAIGSFDRGFTGHRHLEGLDLVHMNGRVFDPTIGRFTSAYPTIQFPLLIKNYDRYSYAANNPLRYIDHNGFSLLGDLWKAVTTPFKKAFHWVEQNWKTIVIVVVAVVITVASYGTLGPVAAGMLAGAASGALGAWFYGGNVFEGAFIGAVFGGLSAGFGTELGAAVSAEFGSTAGTVAGSVGRGLISGLQSEYYGGGFWQGFASGAVSQAFSGYISCLPDYSLKTVANFVLGGTVSVVGGGKFENGAITAAYASLLAGTLVEGQQQGKSVGQSLVEYGERLLDIGTKIITLPNTAIGLVYGGLGLLFGGEIPTIADYEKYNAIVFRNSPLASSGGAITFGNAVTQGGGLDEQQTEEQLQHEMVHTYQAQALGLGYIPAQAAGVTLGFASGGWAWGRGTTCCAPNDWAARGWHGNLNFMEGSPFSSHLYGEKQ